MRIGIIGGTGTAEALGVVIQGDPVELQTPFGRPSSPITLATVGGVQVALLSRHGPGHVVNATHVPYRANIHALKQVGVTQIVACGAVGSLRAELPPGEVVVPDQIIDRTYRRTPSFFDELSIHVELSSPFCAAARAALIDSAADGDSGPVHGRGTYVCIEGPQLSTRAESEMHRRLGADLVGMTAMPEARLAREAQLCYALLALPTDSDGWQPTAAGQGEASVLLDVAANLKSVTARGVAVIRRALPKLAAIAREPCACRRALEHAVWLDRALVSAEARERLKLLIAL